jgi:hypothetical protein
MSPVKPTALLLTGPPPEEIVCHIVFSLVRVRQQSSRDMLNLIIPIASRGIRGTTVVDVNVAA